VNFYPMVKKEKEKCRFYKKNVASKIIVEILETFAKLSKAQDCGKKKHGIQIPRENIGFISSISVDT